MPVGDAVRPRGWWTGPVRIETARLALASVDEWRAVANLDRSGRAWAEDYPTEGDVVIAGLVVAGMAAPPTDADPWGPFQVRERDSGLAIGGAGFKGPPDVDGCVEIGYGLAPSARGRGYAREAVQALCDLAVARGVRAVTAETEAGNVASARVLEACGFAVAERDGAMTYWRWEPVSRG